MAGVDADAVDAAVEFERDDAVGDGGGEAEEHRVAGARGLGEAEDVLLLGEVGGAVAEGGALALRDEVAERAGHDGEVPFGREDDGLLALGALRRDLGALGQADGLLLRRGEPEGDVGARGGGREEGDADEVEEGQVVLLGDAIEPVDDLVGHVGHGLHEGHAGVRDVVVGPLRGALLDVALGVVHELLEAAVVEVGRGQCHQRSLSGESPVVPGSSWEGMT
ncbi:hypothetical protein GA0115246_110455 [Streptomyces sp. SolWspMP-sol7th]|nr:hypothetical protein GA0115246_110455 [Streptomyces sp. SolWspMP-sol7th]